LTLYLHFLFFKLPKFSFRIGGPFLFPTSCVKPWGHPETFSGSRTSSGVFASHPISSPLVFRPSLARMPEVEDPSPFPGFPTRLFGTRVRYPPIEAINTTLSPLLPLFPPFFCAIDFSVSGVPDIFSGNTAVQTRLAPPFSPDFFATPYGSSPCTTTPSLPLQQPQTLGGRLRLTLSPVFDSFSPVPILSLSLIIIEPFQYRPLAAIPETLPPFSIRDVPHSAFFFQIPLHACNPPVS